MCAKSFRGACAYDKFPGRSDDAMCGGLEIGEALLGHFLCGSKGAFFFGFAVFIFYFFFGGVVSGIFRLKNVFYFTKFSLLPPSDEVIFCSGDCRVRGLLHFGQNRRRNLDMYNAFLVFVGSGAAALR